MDAQKRLQQLLDSKGWTAYRLAKKCNLSESTLANIFRRNTMPSISTLEAICQGFGISLAQFFSENDMVELTPDLKELFDGWALLSPEQKKAVLKIIELYNE